MYCPVFPFEFRNVQAEYPIFFHKNAEDKLVPVALFGFETGENLYLDGNQWLGDYVPGIVRREPFMISYQSSGQEGMPDSRMVALDLEHPRVSKTAGEALFEGGNRSPYLQEIATLLEILYDLGCNPQGRSPINPQVQVQQIVVELSYPSVTLKK